MKTINSIWKMFSIGTICLLAFSTLAVAQITVDGLKKSDEPYKFLKSINTSSVRGDLYWYQDTNKDLYFCWITSRGLNDNVYSNTASDVTYAGWPKHDFKALRNSDHIVYKLKNPVGSTVVDVDLDYLFWNGTDQKFYAGLGSGNYYDGAVRVGGSYILNTQTSLQYDIYNSVQGYSTSLIHSPAYPETDHPDWEYQIIYEFKVSKNAVGSHEYLGTDKPNADLPDAHNSPPKDAGVPEIHLEPQLNIICVDNTTNIWYYTVPVKNIGNQTLQSVKLTFTYEVQYFGYYDSKLDGNPIAPDAGTNNKTFSIGDIAAGASKEFKIWVKKLDNVIGWVGDHPLLIQVELSASCGQKAFATDNTIKTCQAQPVQLVSFSSSILDQSVELKWRTATEVNNYGFEVQRSGNRNDWRVISFIEGHGTVNTPQSYSYKDENIGRLGSSFKYRLKQIDRDGSFEYSPIIDANFRVAKKDFGFISANPNPFNPSTMLSYNLPKSMMVSLKIYNVLGEVVMTIINEEQLSNGMHTSMFNASQLPSGTYYAWLTSGDIKSVYRLTLTR